MLVRSFSILLLFVGIIWSDPVPKTKKYYGFIFDADSMRTRLNIFDIDIDKDLRDNPTQNINYPVSLISLTDCKVAFEKDLKVDDAKKSIGDCIDDGLKSIKNDDNEDLVWMQFAGTEHLRNLEKSEKAKFTPLMDAVEEAIKSKKPINLSGSKIVDVIDIISEAEFVYISAIYVEGTKKVEEKGIMDIGKESFHVAFPISKDSKLHSVLKPKSLNLFETEYKYTNLVFKCGGIESVKSIYMAGLLKDASDTSKDIKSPCHPTGFVYEIETDKLKSSCSAELFDKLKLPKKIKIIGDYNEAECEKRLSDAFCHDEDAKVGGKCILSIDPKSKISVSDKIKLNLMGFWTYFSHNLKVQDYKGLIKEMEKMFKNNDCDMEGSEVCFSARYLVYISNFFVKDEDEAEVGKEQKDWPVGKMLVETKLMFVSVISAATIAIIVIATLIAVAALCALFWYLFSKRRQGGAMKGRSAK